MNQPPLQRCREAHAGILLALDNASHAANRPDPVRLLAVRDGECRWPLGDVHGPDTLMCGGEAVRGPYCPYHSHLAGGQGTPSERRAIREAKRVAA